MAHTPRSSSEAVAQARHRSSSEAVAHEESIRLTPEQVKLLRAIRDKPHYSVYRHGRRKLRGYQPRGGRLVPMRRIEALYQRGLVRVGMRGGPVPCAVLTEDGEAVLEALPEPPRSDRTVTVPRDTPRQLAWWQE